MVSLVTTKGFASKLGSLDCEPLCVENLVWSLPAGDNDDRRRTELPKLSSINSVRHNRRVQRMFQRRSWPAIPRYDESQITALAEATLSSMSFHILCYLLALARARFSPDTDAAPGVAPGAAAFSDGVLPLGSPK